MWSLGLGRMIMIRAGGMGRLLRLLVLVLIVLAAVFPSCSGSDEIVWVDNPAVQQQQLQERRGGVLMPQGGRLVGADIAQVPQVYQPVKINYLTWNQGFSTFKELPDLGPTMVHNAIKDAVLQRDPDLIVLCAQETKARPDNMAEGLKEAFPVEFEQYEATTGKVWAKSGVAGGWIVGLQQTFLIKKTENIYLMNSQGAYTKNLVMPVPAETDFADFSSRSKLGTNLKGALLQKVVIRNGAVITTACAHYDTQNGLQNIQSTITEYKKNQKLVADKASKLYKLSSMLVIQGDVNLRKAWPLRTNMQLQEHEEILRTRCEAGKCPKPDKDTGGLCHNAAEVKAMEMRTMLAVQDPSIMEDLVKLPTNENEPTASFATAMDMFWDNPRRPFTYKLQKACTNTHYLTAIGGDADAAATCFISEEDVAKIACETKHHAFQGGVLDRVGYRAHEVKTKEGQDPVSAISVTAFDSETVVGAADGRVSDHVPTVAYMTVEIDRSKLTQAHLENPGPEVEQSDGEE